MQKSVRERRCAVCGGAAEEGALCECCRESFALCDMEEYPRRKKRRTEMLAEICAPSCANAFK